MKPDVVVLNVSMPRMNGFQAADEIKKQVPEPAIVILSTRVDPAMSLATLDMSW
jgi:DNA-binding NarL/FixJ family response regulator